MTTVLQTKGLSKRFGGLQVTNNVNFELQENQIKGLIGPNGAGKTTFFNLLTGLIPCDKGEILYFGQDITGLKPHKRARQGLIRTYQVTSIYPKLTIFENVRLAAHLGFSGKMGMFKNALSYRQVLEKVDQILEIMGIEHMKDELASEVSMGDQRLLEISIALGSKPKVLLLDEPTAGLSARETIQFVDKIQELYDQKIITNILLIEHDIEVVTDLAHSLCVLNHGEIISDGDTDTVCNDERVQEVYLSA